MIPAHGLHICALAHIASPHESAAVQDGEMGIPELGHMEHASLRVSYILQHGAAAPFFVILLRLETEVHRELEAGFVEGNRDEPARCLV